MQFPNTITSLTLTSITLSFLSSTPSALNDTDFNLTFTTTEESIPITTETQFCSNDADCTITCSSSPNHCQNHVIYCPDTPNFDYSCIIQCTHEQSCLNMVIYATNSLQLNISCTEEDACSNMEIHAPATTHTSHTTPNPNSLLYFYTYHRFAAQETYINATYTSNILISCAGERSCAAMTLFAESANNLVMTVAQTDVLDDLVLYATYLTNNFNLDCKSAHSCNNQLIFLNNSHCDVTINCDSSTSACDGSKWYFNNNTGNSMDIICNSCENMVINTENKQIGNIELVCDDSGCNNMEFYVANSANNEYYTNVQCKDDDVCTKLRIYSVDGYRYDSDSYGLEFICDGNNYCNNITIFCGISYQYSCEIEYNPTYLSLFDNSNNNDNGIICKPRNGPSNGNCGQTSFPTSSPTDPTNNPTVLPTIPTIEPTDLPTQVPVTGAPSVNPTTRAPTKDGNSGGGGGGSGSGSFLDGPSFGKYLGWYIGVFLVVSLCCGGCCFWYLRELNKRDEEIEQKREEKERKVIERLERTTVLTANNSGVVVAPAGSNSGDAERGIEMQQMSSNSGNNNVSNNGDGNDGNDGNNGDSNDVDGGDNGGNNEENEATRAASGRSNTLEVYGASPAVRAHIIKKERKEMGIDEDEEAPPDYQEKNKDGYGLVMDEEDVDKN